MKELWTLLVSAQENIGGIPSSLLEKKKEEIKQRKVCAFTEYVIFGINTIINSLQLHLACRNYPR